MMIGNAKVFKVMVGRGRFSNVSTVGPRTERILGREKTRSSQNRSDWGQAYIVKRKNAKICVQFEVRLIYYVYRSA